MTIAERDLVTVSLSRSAIYGVIAAAFRHPENPQFRSMEDPLELDALCAAIRAAVDDRAEQLVDLVRTLHDTAQMTNQQARIKEFIRLFGHTSRGVVPPYETEYGSGGPFSQPQEMSDIAGFFNAFGLLLDVTQHERFDHICCELEFMCFLCAKQAHALEAGHDSDAAEIVRTQRIFLRDHLARFAHTFFMRISKESSIAWHGVAARLALEYIDAECHRLGVAVERAYLPLRPVDSFDVPMACGSCAQECPTERFEE